MAHGTCICLPLINYSNTEKNQSHYITMQIVINMKHKLQFIFSEEILLLFLFY